MVPEPLSYQRLKDEIQSLKTAAIRRISTLKPAGGEHDKVFPPTYQDGPYAVEHRLVQQPDGSFQTVRTVLLDSVQSQANRMELALLRAWREGQLPLPMLIVDFSQSAESWVKEIGQVTVLEAPHRIADAIFRDSLYQGRKFRASIGACLDRVRPTQATELFELCPTSLIFGFWDSTGPKGGLGVKFPRLIVSEIVGFNAVDGVRPAGRIDPLQIENIENIGAPMYRTPEGEWTFDETKAAKSKQGNPIKVKPSEINHGNIPPALRDDQGRLHHGGVTISRAVQTTVFSLAGLRRLRFPVNGSNDEERDLVARTALAALGLAAICLLDQDGYDLRSRCLLVPESSPFEFVRPGETEPFTLTAEQAIALVREAADRAEQHGLKWRREPVILTPSPELEKLIVESRKKTFTVSE